MTPTDTPTDTPGETPTDTPADTPGETPAAPTAPAAPVAPVAPAAPAVRAAPGAPASGSAAAAIAAVEETVHQVTHHQDTPTPGQPDTTSPDTSPDTNPDTNNPDTNPDAAGRDAAGPDDVLTALAGLRAVQDRLATWEPLLIGAARARGASWAAIAPALGLASRQAAERRYLRLNPHATNPTGMTGEQRVKAARDRRAGDRAANQWARDNAPRLRRLAAQITALDNLDPTTQQAVDRVLHALGNNDTATLLTPLADAGHKLQHTHPTLAEQAADITTTTNRLRHPT
ncbi:hypothetical protein [Kribbella sp. NPDC004875]|uniref:hypothetical protein n=1 Tax=Kribbella sp. NPDC004875 TaxID=3364107 RepID=UPI0036D16162